MRREEGDGTAVFLGMFQGGGDDDGHDNDGGDGDRGSCELSLVQIGRSGAGGGANMQLGFAVEVGSYYISSYHLQ